MVQAIVVNNLYKMFGKVDASLRKQIFKSNSNGDKSVAIAVDRVSFEVNEGEIFGVLGLTGSGKSTLIRLIATLLLPDKGDIQVFGYDAVKQPLEVQRLINRISVGAGFFKKLSPMENLLYGAHLHDMNSKEPHLQVEEILLNLGLKKDLIYGPMDEISRGMQRKVAIARALLTRPRLLLLDEPTTGLDSSSKQEVQEVIEELNHDSGITILLTTNDVVEAENLCDRIAIFDSGKIVALDTPQGLKQIASPNGHELALEDVFLELTGKTLVRDEIA